MITYHHVVNGKVKDATTFGMKLSEYGDNSIKQEMALNQL